MELKKGVKDQFDGLNRTVTELLGQLNEFGITSMRMANEARDLVDEGLELVEGE